MSLLFGGLAICAIEAVVDKAGREHIIEVNDTALPLMGDSQEDDRRYMAELVATKMQVRNRWVQCLMGANLGSIDAG